MTDHPISQPHAAIQQVAARPTWVDAPTLVDVAGTRAEAQLDFSDHEHELDAVLALSAPPGDPESLAIRRAERQEIDAAIAALPIAFREAVVLRELEDLSYRDIARITDVPIGTVMSRLSRARHLLAAALRPEATRNLA